MNYQIVASFVAVVGLIACGTVETQSWNYQTYDVVPTSPSEAGYIVLERNGESYKFRMVAPGLAPCYVAPLDAKVETSNTTLTITPEPRHSHCEQFRFVINRDGTGGIRQDWNGSTWRTDRRNRLLTTRQ